MLLLLPAELRLQILSYLIPTGGVYTQQPDKKFYYHEDIHGVDQLCPCPYEYTADLLNVLCISKTVSSECRSILYSMNTIVCHRFDSANEFFSVIGKHNTRHIKRFGVAWYLSGIDIEGIPADKTHFVFDHLPSLDTLIVDTFRYMKHELRGKDLESFRQGKFADCDVWTRPDHFVVYQHALGLSSDLEFANFADAYEGVPVVVKYER